MPEDYVLDPVTTPHILAECQKCFTTQHIYLPEHTYAEAELLMLIMGDNTCHATPTPLVECGGQPRLRLVNFTRAAVPLLDRAVSITLRQLANGDILARKVHES